MINENTDIDKRNFSLFCIFNAEYRILGKYYVKKPFPMQTKCQKMLKVEHYS